jgi:hypothetical protein
MLFKEWFCKYYPLVATGCFEVATIGQIARMIREQSAAGQEPLSWLLAAAGLFGFGLWYKYTVPEQRLARYAAYVGGGANLIALSTVIYFRT